MLRLLCSFGETIKHYLRAEQQFSVPAPIIAAILSVETALGRYQGTYSVLDALYTLGFHYPPRGDFFGVSLQNIFS